MITLPTSGPVADAIAAQLAKVGKSASVQTKTIAPGTAETFKVTGAYAYLISTPIRVLWRLDGQPLVPGHVGSSLTCRDGSFFEWIEVHNPSSAAISVQLFAGFAEYHEERDAPDAAPEPMTDVKAVAIEGGNSIPAEESIIIDPLLSTDVANVIRRKALIVTNRHASLELEIWAPTNDAGTSSFPIATVWPRSTLIVHASGRLTLYNPSTTTAVTFYAGQIYYVTEPFATS